ncbi:hypothetical protein PtA15_2A531 [Puccinia triticina]|uniref:Uncharacterized protein n=1 Tax=Puccinia triticina TaxID=208348 RepID=A0ABY7CAP4_9BASI|nr:uncharacterized protein PtA15_2A531 [Puccinia triticina]WAQ82214.1 hypothetical protein PtA15_2A531 [Puccinia triticina]
MHIDNKTDRQEAVIRQTSVAAGVVEVPQIPIEVALARIEAAVEEIRIAEEEGVQIEVAVDDVEWPAKLPDQRSAAGHSVNMQSTFTNGLQIGNDGQATPRQLLPFAM